eukprot:756016-Hanusia_phi.AAC.1
MHQASLIFSHGNHPTYNITLIPPLAGCSREPPHLRHQIQIKASEGSSMKGDYPTHKLPTSSRVVCPTPSHASSILSLHGPAPPANKVSWSAQQITDFFGAGVRSLTLVTQGERGGGLEGTLEMSTVGGGPYRSAVKVGNRPVPFSTAVPSLVAKCGQGIALARPVPFKYPLLDYVTVWWGGGL